MSDAPPHVVFDCNVFAQVLLSPHGPAGRCLDLARNGQIKLFASEYVLDEIQELYLKLPAKAAINQEDTEDLAQQIRGIATMIDNAPHVFTHPIDPDDSAYVNLAVAANATLIVSRDNHLLKLTDPATPWSKEFRERFPNIKVLQPNNYLAERDREHQDIK
jgi:putative PIN family toxin of toxin-antitoxin system